MNPADNASAGAPPAAGRPASTPPPHAEPYPRRPIRWGRWIWVGLLTFFVFLGLSVVTADDELDEKGPKVGVVPVKNTITDAKEVIASLRKFRKDKRIKAVLVAIDSPGGGVGASQEIYREILRLKKHKPVVAAMGGMAASGGYYVASAASKIIANPGTITGSIGVIMVSTDVRELLRLTRIGTRVFKAGKFKDTLSPLREMTAEEEAYVQKLIDEMHGQFIADIAKGRGLPKSKIVPLADGRIYTGATAKKHGLVDKLGNFSDGLDLALKLAKVSGDPVPVYHRKHRSLVERMLREGVVQARQALRDGVRSKMVLEARDPRL